MNVCTNFYDIGKDEAWVFFADGKQVKNLEIYKQQISDNYYFCDGLPNTKQKRRDKKDKKDGKNNKGS